MSMLPLPPALFEACVDSVTSARRAAAAGAGRLELCSSLVEGGVTPSLGLIQCVVQAVAPLPVHVLVRPRGGDFCYDEDELAVMDADAAAAIAAGAVGIVIGALTPAGELDVAAMRRLVAAGGAAAAAAGKAAPAITLHRAIDVCADWQAALCAAAEAGVTHVLTSGCAPSALEGAPVLRQMVTFAAERGITVVAGGGVTPDTASGILAAVPGLRQLHGTARGLPTPGRCRYFPPGPPVYMGGERRNTPETERSLRFLDESAASSIVAALGALL